MSTPDTFVRELGAVGIDARSPWDLVNRRTPYGAAVPVLLDWLDRVDVEVNPRQRANFREGLVRSLSVKEARGLAGKALVHEFHRQDAGPQYRWTVANALEVLADRLIRDDLVDIATDARYGTDRQMVVLALARVSDPPAIELLIRLLDDPDVAGHAAKALGRLRAENARPALERLLEDDRRWIRAEARRALAKIP